VSVDVVGIGENSVDVVYRLPSAIAPNAKIPVASRRVAPGGQVTTTLATCAALGLNTAYVGAFGHDSAGLDLRDDLERLRVDTRHAVMRPVRNRSAVILVDEQSGDRAVLWERDPQLALRPNEIPHDLIASARVLHVDDVDVDAALAAARIARRASVTVTCDIDAVTARTRDLLAEISVVIVAEAVPAALTGDTDPERALRAMRRWHSGLLCVTLGSRGAMMLINDHLHYSPAFAVDVVDSTGAGDVFRGAFIAAMLRGDDPDAVLRYANAAAAISCTREGAVESAPDAQEVERLVVAG